MQQDFQGQEYYQWRAIFIALTDGIDRSRDVKMPIKDAVYVAILTGTKYHIDEKCTALRNASKLLTMDLSEAKERGFEACGRCN